MGGLDQPIQDFSEHFWGHNEIAHILHIYL